MQHPSEIATSDYQGETTLRLADADIARLEQLVESQTQGSVKAAEYVTHVEAFACLSNQKDWYELNKHISLEVLPPKAEGVREPVLCLIFVGLSCAQGPVCWFRDAQGIVYTSVAGNACVAALVAAAGAHAAVVVVRYNLRGGRCRKNTHDPADAPLTRTNCDADYSKDALLTYRILKIVGAWSARSGGKGGRERAGHKLRHVANTAACGRFLRARAAAPAPAAPRHAPVGREQS